MARSKHASKAKAPKPPVVKPAWPTRDETNVNNASLLHPPVVKPAWPTRDETNVNNASFLQPSEFVLPKTLILEILGRIPCRYTHKDYLLTSRLVTQLDKTYDEDQTVTESYSISQETTDVSGKSIMDADNIEVKKRAKSKYISHDAPRLRRFGTRICMRRCVNLTAQTIKYGHVIRQLFDVSDFFSVHPDLREDAALVRVIFCDFLDRQLELRMPLPKEELQERCLSIENAIKDMHIRICADFARIRIKNRAPTLPDLLEEKVKELEKAVRKMPLFVWVNQLMISIPQAIALLQDAGFVYSPTASVRMPARSQFQPDLHCPDLLVFNRTDADELDCLAAFKKHKLNFGDKLECLALHLLMKKCDAKMTVTLVNPNSTYFGVHAESLFVARYGKEALSGKKIFRMILTGAPMKSVDDEIMRLGESGAKSVTILEDVVNTGKWPTSELVLVYGCSSMTGIIDPLEYLMFSERADTSMLYGVLEYNHNHILDLQTPVYLRTNLESLKHAFDIPGVQTVFFLAHSIRTAETAQLVQKSIDLTNNRSQGTSGLVWGVVRPVQEDFVTTEYIRLTQGGDGLFVSPSKECNGGYICLIERQLSKIDMHAPKEIVSQKKTTATGGNVNNKFRLSGGPSSQQRNLHNRAKPRHVKKWMTARGHGAAKNPPPPGAASAKRPQTDGDGDLEVLDVEF